MCGTWSPNDYVFDTCTSGCGTKRDGEFLYDDLRTMYLEPSPDGACTSQVQARGRECIGALRGLEGSYGPYSTEYCVFVANVCSPSEPEYTYTECTDASPHPPPGIPPAPPVPPSPPPPPSLPGVCSNSCLTSGDGFCQDGGDGASNALCTFGTDCIDCGTRISSPPPPPPSPPMGPCPYPPPPRKPPKPPPVPGFFDNQTNVIIVVSVGGAVFLGILLIALSYVLTPERAKSLGVVFGSIAKLIGRGGGSEKKDDPKQATIIVQQMKDPKPTATPAPSASADALGAASASILPMLGKLIPQSVMNATEKPPVPLKGPTASAAMVPPVVKVPEKPSVPPKESTAPSLANLAMLSKIIPQSVMNATEKPPAPPTTETPPSESIISMLSKLVPSPART